MGHSQIFPPHKKSRVFWATWRPRNFTGCVALPTNQFLWEYLLFEIPKSEGRLTDFMPKFATLKRVMVQPISFFNDNSNDMGENKLASMHHDLMCTRSLQPHWSTNPCCQHLANMHTVSKMWMLFTQSLMSRQYIAQISHQYLAQMKPMRHPPCLPCWWPSNKLWAIKSHPILLNPYIDTPKFIYALIKKCITSCSNEEYRYLCQMFKSFLTSDHSSQLWTDNDHLKI